MRLINADALDTRERGNNSQRTMWWHIKQLIDKAPTIEAEPIRHGRWIKEPPYISVGGEYNKALICSECHSFFVSDGNKPWQLHNYCPECGAKMDKEG